MQENKATSSSRGKAIYDGASSSKSSPGDRQYQVFLNFRGEDTRKNFTDHLYCDLTDAGIRTFRDSEELHVGKEIGPELLRAIKESTISIPIFSKGYASSKWCLLELTEMANCKKNRGQIICPIFYDVTPSEVKHQSGSFGADLNRFDGYIVEEWRKALTEVAGLKGWEKDKVANGHEGALVKNIVSDICKMLKRNHSDLTDKLVGMDRHVEEMEKLLDVKGTGVRIVGIHGMGGLGKTTIAKFMYNQLCDYFQQQCSFLENIREKVKQHNGYADLKNQLISNILKRKPDGTILSRNIFKSMTVLVVLDDVDESSQLNEFVGSLDWFGSGSRIIVTTRNLDVLKELRQEHIYRLGVMNFDDSRALFCKHAFRSTDPLQGFEELSREIVLTAAGLPLSLVVIGSSLFWKGKKEWENTLKKLRNVQPGHIQEKLKISYEALEHLEKQIFLDIACHFIGQDKRLAMLMWEDCGFFPENGIPTLIALSLITIENDNIFRMHDHLRDLGRSIVSRGNQSEYSRLRSREDVDTVLSSRLVMRRTVQTFYSQGDRRFMDNAFQGFTSLRYLYIEEGSELRGNFKGLLSELRWLRWRIVTDSLRLTNFCPNKLVILDLSGSAISNGWDKLIQIKTAINLKVLNLSNCHRITKTPKFSAVPNLERLILKSCRSLTKISSSVKHLKRLTYFNATDCRSLSKLPLEFGSMEALEEVYLDYAFSFTIPKWRLFLDRTIINPPPLKDVFAESFKLAKYIALEGSEVQPPVAVPRVSEITNIKIRVEIPGSFWDLKSLCKLGLSGIQIKELSQDIGKLKNLTSLFLCSSNVKSLPDAIGELVNLEELDLSHSEIETLPNAIGKLCNLRKLNLSNAAVKRLPVDIGNLKNLNSLYLGSSNIKRLPDAIGKLVNLQVLDLSHSEIEILPNAIKNLCNLRKLNLSHTPVKRLPVDIVMLSRLEELDCFKSKLEGDLPTVIRSLSSLRILRLGLTNISVLSLDISASSRLVALDLGFCDFRFTADLKLPSSLKLLGIPFSTASFNSLTGLMNLTKLWFTRGANTWADNPTCMTRLPKLVELRFIGLPQIKCLPVTFGGNLSQLNVLGISDCSHLQNLPDLSHLQMLRKLTVKSCPVLTEMGGFDKLHCLEYILIRDCKDLQRLLPHLKNLRSLKAVDISDCANLRSIQGLEALTSLESLTLRGCPFAQNLPDSLSKSRNVKVIIE